ncbi:MAG: hypothetical protein LBR29_07920, partial [Methylobacteriaceae bacterium]|nr:hypothetical protein [Methylobacteriaceae bacterium]
MGETKRMICLANSRKHNQRCIAGVELDNRAGTRWIRPVASRNSGWVSTGTAVRGASGESRSVNRLEVLDIVEFPVLERIP